MIQAILFVIGIFSFSFIEPFLYYSFGISALLILCYVLFNKRIKLFSIILVLSISLILDTTLKFPIGSHLLSVASVMGVWYIFERFIPANLPFFEFVKLYISFVFGVLILKYLNVYSITSIIFFSTLLPALLSAILATILGLIFSQFGSNNSLNKLKIK